MKRYKILLILLALPLSIYAVWISLRHKESRYLKERFGLIRNNPNKSPVWIHAASVGEVNAVMPLINLIRQRCPDIYVCLTTNTPTGSKIAYKTCPDKVEVFYLPFDYSICNRIFLKRLQPVCALIMETEIWPNLYKTCHNKNIPLLIINGRISARTLNVSGWIKQLYATTLSYTDAILTRSDTDRTNYMTLGADPEKTEVTGNLKFSRPTVTSTTPTEITRPFILAASTRENEELIILKSFHENNTHERLLVIVPRHPHRTMEILKDIDRLGLNIAVRSRHDPITEDTHIYLADTIGELGRFISDAEFVFMGGSLVPRGGQNILEVARAGKAVIFGPYMDNFKDEAQLLVNAGAAIQVSSADELLQQMIFLQNNPGKLQEMAASGLQIMEQYKNMHEHYLQAISERIPAIKSLCYKA